MREYIGPIHAIVVTPDDDYGESEIHIYHPPECEWDPKKYDFDCFVSHNVGVIGDRMFFFPDIPWDDELPVGRYNATGWIEQYNGFEYTEYDYGAELTSIDD